MANNQVQLKDKNSNKCYPNPYWPIGSIFLSMNNTNPSTYFGGTWQLIGQGRTLVGVDTGQTEFNTVNKKGGHKSLQSHSHTISSAGDHNHKTTTELGCNGLVLRWDNAQNGADYWGARYQEGSYKSSGAFALNQLYTGSGGTHTHTAGNAGEGNAQNLQPYFKVYMWYRTA